MSGLAVIAVLSTRRRIITGKKSSFYHLIFHHVATRNIMVDWMQRVDVGSKRE